MSSPSSPTHRSSSRVVGFRLHRLDGRRGGFDDGPALQLARSLSRRAVRRAAGKSTVVCRGGFHFPATGVPSGLHPGHSPCGTRGHWRRPLVGARVVCCQASEVDATALFVQGRRQGCGSPDMPDRRGRHSSGSSFTRPSARRGDFRTCLPRTAEQVGIRALRRRAT